MGGSVAPFSRKKRRVMGSSVAARRCIPFSPLPAKGAPTSTPLAGWRRRPRRSPSNQKHLRRRASRPAVAARPAATLSAAPAALDLLAPLGRAARSRGRASHPRASTCSFWRMRQAQTVAATAARAVLEVARARVREDARALVPEEARIVRERQTAAGPGDGSPGGINTPSLCWGRGRCDRRNGVFRRGCGRRHQHALVDIGCSVRCT